MKSNYGFADTTPIEQISHFSSRKAKQKSLEKPELVLGLIKNAKILK